MAQRCNKQTPRGACGLDRGHDDTCLSQTELTAWQEALAQAADHPDGAGGVEVDLESLGLQD
jgi:glucose-6-phosphate dehydrogenase assembly protein OpcA